MTNSSTTDAADGAAAGEGPSGDYDHDNIPGKDVLEGGMDFREAVPGEPRGGLLPVDHDSPFQLWNWKLSLVVLLVGGYLYHFRGYGFLWTVAPFAIGFWMLSFAWRRSLQSRQYRHVSEYENHSPEVVSVKPLYEVGTGLGAEKRHDQLRDDGLVNPYFKWRHYLAIPLLIYGAIQTPQVALGVALVLPVATLLWTSIGDYKPMHPLNPIIHKLATPLRWSDWINKKLIPHGVPARGWNAFHLAYVLMAIPLISTGLYLQHIGAGRNAYIQAGVLLIPVIAIVPAVTWKKAISGRYSILSHTAIPRVTVNHWEWEQRRDAMLASLHDLEFTATALKNADRVAGNKYLQRTIGRFDAIQLFEKHGDYSTPQDSDGPIKIGQWEVEQRGDETDEAEDTEPAMTVNDQPEEPDAKATAHAEASTVEEKQTPTDAALEENLEARREDLLFDWQMPPEKDFGDIGGYSDVKGELTKDVLEPVQADNPAYDRFDITPERGILFHGPPGTGKTLFAQALANMLARPFVKLDQSRLSDWRIDSMPQKIGCLFDEAEDLNGVIFIDEIDQLVAQRGDNSGSNKQQKVTNAFLTRIDEKEDPDFIFVGTTNRIDLIDEAMLRPGRFGKQIEVGKPDADARHAILQTKVRDYTDGQSLEGLDSLVESTEGWTGDELDTLVERARKNAAEERAEQLTLDHFPDDPSAAI